MGASPPTWRWATVKTDGVGCNEVVNATNGARSSSICVGSTGPGLQSRLRSGARDLCPRGGSVCDTSPTWAPPPPSANSLRKTAMCDQLIDVSLIPASVGCVGQLRCQLQHQFGRSKLQSVAQLCLLPEHTFPKLLPIQRHWFGDPLPHPGTFHLAALQLVRGGGSVRRPTMEVALM